VEERGRGEGGGEGRGVCQAVLPLRVSNARTTQPPVGEEGGAGEGGARLVVSPCGPFADVADVADGPLDEPLGDGPCGAMGSTVGMEGARRRSSSLSSEAAAGYDAPSRPPARHST
jgi:hypothetical protein